MRQRVLVTGGAGFIGSHLVEQLIADGCDVVVVDKLQSDSPENLSGIVDQVELHYVDIRDEAFTELITEQQFHTIYHLAGNASVPLSVEDPSFDYEVGLAATFRLLQTLRQSSVRTILIFASSAAVYGDPIRIPVHEDDPTVPISPYGVSKLAVERYLSVFSKIYGLRTAAMRSFSLYGPRQQKLVIFDLITKLHRDPHRLPMFGDGSQTRDFIFVGDAIQAFRLVAERGRLQGEVYNLASGREHSILQVAQIICKQLEVQPQFEFTGSVRPGEPQHWLADIGRLQELGYRPCISLEEGIRRTIEWYRQTQAVPRATAG